MIARILNWLFPSTLRVLPEDLHVILNYHERMHRLRPPLVESEAGPAISMMLYCPAPGRYIGLGHEVIKDWRKEVRKNA
jgi:hypothetical protein